MKYEGKYKEMAEQFRRDGADEYLVEKFIREDRFGLIIEGVCERCGHKIARCCD